MTEKRRRFYRLLTGNGLSDIRGRSEWAEWKEYETQKEAYEEMAYLRRCLGPLHPVRIVRIDVSPYHDEPSDETFIDETGMSLHDWVASLIDDEIEEEDEPC